MKRWYIIHAYSGFEKQVLRSLNERIQRSTVADSFGEVLPFLEMMRQWLDHLRYW